jgi:hypothetical protein
MSGKILGLMSAGVAMLYLATTASFRGGTRAESANENGIAQQQAALGVPNLTGQWTGTATIFGEPLSIVINIDQGEDAVTGSCTIGGLPSTPFAVAFSQQQGNLGGTWSVDGRHPRPFSGSLNSQGGLELTLNAGAGKHPNCAINVNGMMSDDGREIAGSFKSSDGCKNKGQTGAFQLISQG